MGTARPRAGGNDQGASRGTFSGLTDSRAFGIAEGMAEKQLKAQERTADAAEELADRAGPLVIT